MKPAPSISSALGHAPSDKRIEILRLIGKSGSISQAARAAGISYKAAWQAVHTLTNLAGVNLVEKAVGGTGGGGAKLTEAGVQQLATADLQERTCQEVLRQLGGKGADAAAPTISRLSIRTSMRNHLPCRVRELQWSGQVVRVILQLADDATLAARITRASAELLALKEGMSVLALCKATAVEVGRKADFQEKPGVNLLQGQAVHISRGEKEDEIFVALSPDLQLVGFAPGEKAIRTSGRVAAAVDESAIVIALIE